MTDVFEKDIAFKNDLVRTPTGDLDTIEGLDNVKEALFRRLITTPGTLVHRPDYGVGIKAFQNTINSIDNRRKLVHRIKEQFAKDPRVDAVSGVSFKMDDDFKGQVEIQVKVKLVGYDEQTMNFTPFNEE